MSPLARTFQTGLRSASIVVGVAFSFSVFAGTAPASAQWKINSFSPNPVIAGCEFTITGQFQSQGSKTVNTGTGSGKGKEMTVTSWSGTTIVAIMPGDIGPSQRWVAIYRSSGEELVKSLQTLQVEAGDCSPGAGPSLARASDISPSRDTPTFQGRSGPSSAGDIPPAGQTPRLRRNPNMSDVAKNAPGLMVERKLTFGDPSVAVQACGMDANSGYCNDVQDSTELCAESSVSKPFLGGIPADATIRGYHANCWGTVGDDTGTDTYSISLKNGWTLEKWDVSVSTSSSDEKVTVLAVEANWKGQSNAVIPVEWVASPADGLAYGITFWIKGPNGTDHY